MSRNVRFYGEMSASSCQYAKTREQLNPDSANSDNNWCWYFENMEGVDRDMHGAHMITTHSFKNWHVSHTEFFNVGQPRLARYPIHWHHAGYVGERGGYADPSSAESNSIHDSFSRWITIHGTHEAIVKDNVGYNCIGHGFFMEDGYEEQNLLQGNLGVLPKPGILLPSERHKDICFLTADGFGTNNGLGVNGGTQTVTDNDGNEIIVGDWWERACEGLSVFWIANIQNFIHDNAAVGGFAGLWVFTHNAWSGYGWQAIPKDPVTGIREWRNNKASASFQGFTMDETVKDDLPSEAHPEPQFSINDVDNEVKVYLKSMEEPEEYMTVPNCDSGPSCNGPDDDYKLNDPRPNVWSNPLSNWARLELNGWNLHHTMGKNWARNANVHLWGWQFSDNHRGYVIKTTSPIMGAQKSLGGSTFVGMTKNTGHRYCAELIWKANLGLFSNGFRDDRTVKFSSSSSVLLLGFFSFVFCSVLCSSAIFSVRNLS